MTSRAIEPIQKEIKQIINLPGSKSITNRALLLGALGEGSCIIKNACIAEDTLCMAECLEKLGFLIKINKKNKIIQIKGESGKIPASTATLDVCNAGTVARFITALCALKNSSGSKYTLTTSNEGMKNRPMKDLLVSLEAIGITFEFLEKEYHFPFILKTSPLKAVSELIIEGSKSSQMISALLLILPHLPNTPVIRLKGEIVSEKMIHMTQKMIQHWGLNLIQEENSYFIKKEELQGVSPKYINPKDYIVEPDASAASYFGSCMAIHKGKVLLKNFHLVQLQPDFYFFNILENLHLIQITPHPEGLIISHRNRNDTIGIMKEVRLNFNTISDTFMSLAAIAPLLPYAITFEGIRHTQFKETNRMEAMNKELQKINQISSMNDNELTIAPKPILVDSVDIETYNDHRIAMSFGVLGTYDKLKNNEPWMNIINAECCQKTFPEFFEILELLHLSTSEEF